MALAVEVTKIGVHVGGRHFLCVVETFGASDAGEDYALDFILVAAAHAVAHLFRVLARPVRGPVGDGVALTAHKDDAVPGFLVSGLVVVAADDGTAVAATAIVAVPEDFHQVSWHSARPDAECTPLMIRQIALVGRFAVALALGTAVGCKAIAGAQFTHQHAQSRPVGVGTSPESHAIVLPHPIRVKGIGDADTGFHVLPCLAFDFVPGVPNEQGLDDDRVGRAGAERWLGQHGVKAWPFVAWRHLVGLMQAAPGGLGKQVVGAPTGVVASPIGKRVNRCEHCLLPPLVHLVAGGSCHV